jgi:amino acid transporter
MPNKPQIGLVRGLGPWAAVAVNVANMIGTGVFLKARVMTCNVGSPMLVLAAWVAAGLLSLAGTFSYAEIAAMMPEVGGDYLYICAGPTAVSSDFSTAGWASSSPMPAHRRRSRSDWRSS